MSKKLKKSLRYCLFLAFIFAVSSPQTSCKTKEGCGMEEQDLANPDNADKWSSKKRGKSGLWSKKQKKRMGK